MSPVFSIFSRYGTCQMPFIVFLLIIFILELSVSFTIWFVKISLLLARVRVCSPPCYGSQSPPFQHSKAIWKIKKNLKLCTLSWKNALNQMIEWIHLPKRMSAGLTFSRERKIHVCNKERVCIISDNPPPSEERFL